MKGNTCVNIPFMSLLTDTQSVSEYMTLMSDLYKNDGYYLQSVQECNELDLLTVWYPYAGTIKLNCAKLLEKID
jgi:hypothetical protein